MLKRFFTSTWAICIFLFVLAILIRIIPEIKAGVWPIGYDTFNSYTAEIATYKGSLINWVWTANILYFLFLPFKALGMSPNLIMKIFGPLLYGGLIVSFFLFAKNFLNFSKSKSFLAALLIVVQLATLRISWDLYRNELALIFLFWGLIYFKEITKPKNLLYFSILAGLVSLSNELVTVLLIIILLVYGAYFLFKRQWDSLISTAIPLLVVAILFTIVISSSGQVLYDPHVFFTSEKNYFWRYFYHYSSVVPYNLLKQIITHLFWLLYGWLLLFAAIGFWRLRRNIVLATMTLWLLLGTFSSLIFLGNGLFVWERWLFMLVFPFIGCAIEGIYFLGSILSRPWGWKNRLPQLALLLAVLFWIIYLGLFTWRALPFLATSYAKAKPPLNNDLINSYFPRTMILTSVGYKDIDDTVKAIEWLDQNAPPGSVILVDNRYRGVMLTHFNLDNRYVITNPWSETIQSSNLEAAKKLNYWPIYLIWNISKAVDGFDRIYSVGDRGIYEALPTFKNSN